MKTNNPRWGARRIVGELRKLGKSISKSTVLNIIKASGLPSGGPSKTNPGIDSCEVTARGFSPVTF
jgi:hypothetical protein